MACVCVCECMHNFVCVHVLWVHVLMYIQPCVCVHMKCLCFCILQLLIFRSDVVSGTARETIRKNYSKLGSKINVKDILP